MGMEVNEENDGSISNEKMKKKERWKTNDRKKNERTKDQIRKENYLFLDFFLKKYY